jgi:hypothetical protein
MSGPLHRAARWLRLVLAFLTVAGASAPAHALPAAEGAVAVWVERYEPAAQRPVAGAPVSLRRVAVAPPKVPSRTVFTGRRLREARTPAPPRRLFLVHRALLH